uniref:Extensin Ext1 n=1 Tax=Solanum tuberosum TaxID=4113 RepID=M1AU21_SOLTU
MGSQMKKQWLQFACALAFFLIATCTMAYPPYSYESSYSTYNKVPTTIVKSEDFKKPSVSEDSYKKVAYVPKVPSVHKEEYKLSSLPKNDYYKKPSVPEDNYKKVPFVPKVPSMTKYDYKVPSLPKNDYFKRPSVPKDNYKKVSFVPKVPSVPKEEYKCTLSQDGTTDKGFSIQLSEEDVKLSRIHDQLIVPSPEGENQVGDRKEQSASRRTVPRCSAISPKVTKLEVLEGQSKKVMELTKLRIADPISDPDLLRRIVLCSTFLGDYKYIFKSLV